MLISKLTVALLLAVTAAGCLPSHQEIMTPRQAPVAQKPGGARISPQSYLRKLSFHLRGQTPERSEYQALAAAQASGAQETFFKAKIAEYLESVQHIDKMSARLE